MEILVLVFRAEILKSRLSSQAKVTNAAVSHVNNSHVMDPSGYDRGLAIFDNLSTLSDTGLSNQNFLFRQISESIMVCCQLSCRSWVSHQDEMGEKKMILGCLGKYLGAV